MNPAMKEARRQTGLRLSDNELLHVGDSVSVLLASDMMNDSSRSFWWLINAPQATASVTGSCSPWRDLTDAVESLQPFGNLYMTEPALNAKGKPIGKIKGINWHPVNKQTSRAIAYEMEGRLKGLD